MAVPMIGFGFMDNLVMIQAGEAIDSTIGVAFGLATMTSAAFGQIVSQRLKMPSTPFDDPAQLPARCLLVPRRRGRRAFALGVLEHGDAPPPWIVARCRDCRDAARQERPLSRGQRRA